MKLTLTRQHFLDKCTIGKLLVDGQDLGIYTLEDKYREVAGQPVTAWKVQDQTAIPKGTYKISIDYSPHFGTNLPHLQNVPGYSMVRIHWGNTDTNTEGCLLVGLSWNGGDFIGESRKAFGILFPKIQAAIAAGKEVTIEIA